MSPEYASEIIPNMYSVPTTNAGPSYGYNMSHATSGLSIPMESTSSPLRRSGRARSNEQDSPSSESKAKRMRNTHLRLPRGVQRQSRNGAAYSGWVTVEGYRLLGPARPTAELASQDRERLAEAKMVGGLPEARKVIQQLHAEVASTRRVKSQYLVPGISGHHGGSSIQLRSSSVSHLSPLTRSLPKSVCVLTPCGAKDMWFLRNDKLYASFAPRTDIELNKGVYLLDFGATRSTVEEARRDVDDISTACGSTEDLGASKIPLQQESVWGFCAVAELVLENKTAFVGVCVFCDVILTAGPARGSRSSAETDAFSMVSEVLSSGISFAANHHTMPTPNPAEDLFMESFTPTEGGECKEEEPAMYEDDVEFTQDDEDKETHVPITPSGDLVNNMATEAASEEWSSNEFEPIVSSTVSTD